MKTTSFFCLIAACLTQSLTQGLAHADQYPTIDDIKKRGMPFWEIMRSSAHACPTNLKGPIKVCSSPSNNFYFNRAGQLIKVENKSQDGQVFGGSTYTYSDDGYERHYRGKVTTCVDQSTDKTYVVSCKGEPISYDPATGTLVEDRGYGNIYSKRFDAAGRLIFSKNESRSRQGKRATITQIEYTGLGANETRTRGRRVEKQTVTFAQRDQHGNLVNFFNNETTLSPTEYLVFSPLSSSRVEYRYWDTPDIVPQNAAGHEPQIKRLVAQYNAFKQALLLAKEAEGKTPEGKKSEGKTKAIAALQSLREELKTTEAFDLRAASPRYDGKYVWGPAGRLEKVYKGIEDEQLRKEAALLVKALALKIVH